MPVDFSSIIMTTMCEKNKHTYNVKMSLWYNFNHYKNIYITFYFYINQFPLDWVIIAVAFNFNYLEVYIQWTFSLNTWFTMMSLSCLKINQMVVFVRLIFMKIWRLNSWMYSFLVRNSPLSRNELYEIQVMDNQTNWEISSLFTYVARIVVHKKEKFTIGKLPLSLLS